MATKPTESRIVTCEAVTAGHPDKLCDAIADALKAVKDGRLDATVFQDARGQGAGAVETALKLIKKELGMEEEGREKSSRSSAMSIAAGGRIVPSARKIA